MDNKEFVILAAKGPGGGGGSVTPESIVTATGQMTPEQAAQTRGNLGAAPAETVVTVSGATPTITPAANTIYECGELSSLTVSTIPQTGDFIISWRSGSTPTTHNFPSSMRFPTATNAMDACEANTDYEINCRNGKCVVTAWPVVSP